MLTAMAVLSKPLQLAIAEYRRAKDAQAALEAGT